MYGGGTSEYYFKHLAGIQQAPGSRGWEHIVLKPAVWVPLTNLSICANLSSAEASVVTSRGQIRAAWRCASAATPSAPAPPPAYPGPAAADSLCEAGGDKLGGNVGERWDTGRHHEIGALELRCTDGGNMSRVEFASYGWPTGNCSAGFRKDLSKRKCDAKDTLKKVTEACIGKSACSVTAGLQPGDTPGGGPDPCQECVKSLAVVLSGCKGTTRFGVPPPPPPPTAVRVRVRSVRAGRSQSSRAPAIDGYGRRADNRIGRSCVGQRCRVHARDRRRLGRRRDPCGWHGGRVRWVGVVLLCGCRRHHGDHRRHHRHHHRRRCRPSAATGPRLLLGRQCGGVRDGE
eukprot:SAG22_NODE_613_length_8567_cov_4.215163_2_plen_345_part_00